MYKIVIITNSEREVETILHALGLGDGYLPLKEHIPVENRPILINMGLGRNASITKID